MHQSQFLYRQKMGWAKLTVKKFPLAKSLPDFNNNIRGLINDEHDFKTAVIDTADWLEFLIWDDLCKDWGVDNIEQVDGGYGKGYNHALTKWRHMLDGLDVLREQRGMCIILLAHSKIEKFEDPESPAYDRYSPRMHKKATALVSEWADAVLFATRKIITKTEDAGFNKKRTTAAGLGKDGGDRVLRCIESPACIAKNRFNLPAELPLSWPALVEAIKAGKASQVKTKPAKGK